MIIGHRNFDIKNHTYVMGILNVTPDSFSDGGRFNTMDKALFHVEQMVNEGMDLIDIGGESTRPGFTKISDEEEIERIAPVINAIRVRFDIPISLDTYKSSVAQAGIQAGVDLINDVWGLKKDANMAKLIAQSGLPCCLMHSREQSEYHNLLQDMIMDFADTIHLAEKAGIADDKIILDPGIGFGKTYEDNLLVLNSLADFRHLGYPMLLGTSRKSVIGLTLDLPVNQRMEGTLATTVLAVMSGYSFVRVHDIKENVRAIAMTEAILKAGD